MPTGQEEEQRGAQGGREGAPRVNVKVSILCPRYANILPPCLKVLLHNHQSGPEAEKGVGETEKETLMETCNCKTSADYIPYFSGNTTWLKNYFCGKWND